MIKTTEQIGDLAHAVREAVWKHLNTRRASTSKSLLPMPSEASAWLASGADLAPDWLRDAMEDGVKAHLNFDWTGACDPIGAPGTETPDDPSLPAPMAGSTPAVERDTFALWVDYAIRRCMNTRVLSDGTGPLKDLPTDVQVWLKAPSSLLAPTSVLDYVVLALDDLNWDDGKAKG